MKNLNSYCAYCQGPRMLCDKHQRMAEARADERRVRIAVEQDALRQVARRAAVRYKRENEKVFVPEKEDVYRSSAQGIDTAIDSLISSAVDVATSDFGGGGGDFGGGGASGEW